MKKVWKKFKMSILGAVIFMAPPTVYLLANYYWWLFDGNVLNADKMVGAAIGLGAGFFVVMITAAVEDFNS